MKAKCCGCGEVKDMSYVFEYNSYVHGYRLEFCYDCGGKIEEFFKEKGWIK